MKRLLLMVGLFLTTLSGYAQATTEQGQKGSPESGSRGVKGTSAGETVRILLTCLNQAGFKKYYAANAAGPVHVIGLPADMKLPSKATALGRTLHLGSSEQVASGSLSNYFFLGRVKNEGKHVSVSLTYFYSHSAEGYKVVMVDMELAQNGDQYQIVNANFKGDLL